MDLEEIRSFWGDKRRFIPFVCKMDEPENQNKPKPEATTADPETEAKPATGDGTKPVSKMTPEEQMAAFEKAMKEDDWGHQPC